MTWFDLVNKRATKHAIALVNNIMADGEIRSINELLDEMFNEVKRMNKDRSKHKRTWGTLSGKHHIPTRTELTAYLSNSNKYGSGLFDRDTGKPASRSKSEKVRLNQVRKYWLRSG